MSEFKKYDEDVLQFGTEFSIVLYETFSHLPKDFHSNFVNELLDYLQVMKESGLELHDMKHQDVVYVTNRIVVDYLSKKKFEPMELFRTTYGFGEDLFVMN